MPNTLETMIDEAIMRGLAEGKAEGKRDALRAMLQARFGTIPAALEQRIGTADMEALDAMIARAAVAERIDNV